jgi:poly-gamma-glutamate synthesis protein (capsule biosynthesis protein)
VAPAQVRFAHRLIDGGVDLIYGHSSHHPGPDEVFGGRLVLYGCGDCINDYERITGHERYRGDLRLLYFASLQLGTGALAALRMAPMRVRKLRLYRAAEADGRWLGTVMERASSRFGSRIDLGPDGLLALRSGRS